MVKQGRDRGRAAWLAIAVLLASLAAVAMAPAVVPAGYSPVTDSISESAGQAVLNGWVARAGLLLFGLGVLWLAEVARERWGRAGTTLHRAFGLLMVASAVFSAKAWQGSGIAYVAFEDTLHSWAASVMGMAFAFGVMAVGTRRVQREGRVQALDLIAFAAAFAIPALMFYVLPGFLGVAQRAMFLVAYAWYGMEALRLVRAHGAAPIALIVGR